MDQLGKYLTGKQLALRSVPSTHSAREGGSSLPQAHPTQPSPANRRSCLKEMAVVPEE